MKQNEAITLITLVVTIVLLIILAGVTINLTVGENGLLTKAKQAKEEYKISELLETLELEKTDLMISKNGKAPSITEYIDHLVSKGIITTADIEDIDENTKNITVGGYIFSLETDENGNIVIANQVEAPPPPTAEAGATTHEATSLTYTWAKLEKMAKVISDNYGTETGKINSDTAEVKVTINGVTYTLGVGDTTTVNDSTGEAKIVRILGFNHDILSEYSEDSDGNPITYSNIYGGENKYAGISFEYVDFLTTAKMNSSDTNSGGWKASEMYTILNGSETITGKIDELENKDQIKQVTKKYCATYNSATLSDSNDYLWLLSCAEIWNNGYKSTGKGYSTGTEGSQYKYYKNINATYNSINNYLKKPSSVAGTSSDGTNWYLRSTYYNYSTYFCFVTASGICSSNIASYSRGAAPGFAI